VRRCAQAEGHVDQGGHLPAKIKLRWIFAYVVQRNVLTIPKFTERVCLTACEGLPGLHPSVPKQGAP
jgi:hypothetical protein